MDKSNIPNAGFPPLKLIEEISTDNNKTVQKERFFAEKPKVDLNIRDVLVTKKIEPIINVNDKEINIVTEI